MGFLKGSMKHLQIHIFIIFRVHKLIPNCQFLVSSILDLASLLEACVGRAGCVEDDNPFYPSYGCFCGLRIRGPEPVDCFDRACERHWECINEGVNDMGCSEFELQAWPYIYHMVDGEVR